MATETDMLDYLDYLTQDVEGAKGKLFIGVAMASHLRSAFPGVANAEEVVDRWFKDSQRQRGERG